MKYIIIFINLLMFTTLSCKSQNNNVDVILLNKVIKSTKLANDSIYKLNENINYSKDRLNKYYKYKFLNKPFYDVIIDYNKENDSIIYENTKNEKQRDSIWSVKYSIIDSLFSKEDIEYFIKQEGNAKWDFNRLKIKGVNIKKSVIGGNYISVPFYSLNGKYAIIEHKSLKKFTTLFIFKKLKKRWELIDSIKNF